MAVKIGPLVMGAFALNQILAVIGLVPNWANSEPFGVLVLFATFLYVGLAPQFKNVGIRH